jgi:hypothetical protein
MRAGLAAAFHGFTRRRLTVLRDPVLIPDNDTA